MKEASVFLLDEPTSGLDANASSRLLTALHVISRKGVNVVVTIHQPRREIFNLFDNLLLLAHGGREMFFGPCKSIGSYLETLGYSCPPQMNLADFVLDLTAEDREHVEYLCIAWVES